MYSLPMTVVIDSHEFHIRNKGDFRMVLDCFSALNDAEMSEDARVLASLLIFYEELNTIEDIYGYQSIAGKLVSEMYRFFNCGQEESVGTSVNKPVIDWDKDSNLICAAINNVANQEIRAMPYLHWWTFIGYYMSVGESALATVVGIRQKIIKGKKLEKWEKEFKREHPNYFVWNSATLEDKEAENAIRELWNSGR